MTQSIRQPVWSECRFLVFDWTRGLSRYIVRNGRVHSVEWICKTVGHWYMRHSAVSPDGRWLYAVFHADTVLIDLDRKNWYWLNRNKKKIPASLYRLVWSPDSQYLAGVALEGEYCHSEVGLLRAHAHIALFTAPPSEPRILVRTKAEQNEFIHAFGWYPDSRAIWYATGKHFQFISNWRWYKVSLPRREVTSLGQHAIQRIQNDWDFLPSAYRYGSVPVRSYAYTADRMVRIRSYFLMKRDTIERPLIWYRGKPPVRLNIPQTISWNWLEVMDVSADHRWLLVRTDNACYAVEINTNNWQTVILYKEAPILFNLEAVRHAEFTKSARLMF